ncbi:MAG: RNA polymerase sigma factor [Ignavibacteria bacterium]
MTLEEEKLFKEIYDSNIKRIYNLCYGYLHNVEDTEDVTQEIFVKVYKNLRKFKGNSSLQTWIYRIAVNEVLDFIKHKKRKKRFGLVKQIISIDEESENFEIPSGEDGSFDEFQKREVLLKAIRKLNHNQQRVLMLFYYGGLNHEEIATVMKKSVSSVESLIFRAKRNLRNILYKFYSEIK